MPVSPGSFNYVLAPWTLRSIRLEGPGGSPRFVERWTGPPGTVVALDLRPRAAQEIRTPDGFGLFVLNTAADIPAGALYLGNDFDAAQVAADAEVISRLELKSGDLGRATLLDSVWSVLTELSDPTFTDRTGPLTPDRNGNIVLRLHRHGVLRAERYSAEKHPQVLTLARANYARLAAGNAKYLDSLARKLGVRAQDIAVPAGGATFGDTFEASSNTALGSWTPTGTNAGTGWTALNGTWQATAATDTGEQTTVTDPGSARLDDDLDGDDMTVTVSVYAITDFRAGGPIGRVSDSATSYIAYSRDVSNTNSHELFTVVGGGAPSQVATVNNQYPDPATPYDLVLTLDGTSAECDEAGVNKISTTVASTWDGFLRGGMYSNQAASNGGVQFVSIVVEDLAGGGTEQELTQSAALSIEADTPAATIANATPQTLTQSAALSIEVDTPAATISNGSEQTLTQSAALGLRIGIPGGSIGSSLFQVASTNWSGNSTDNRAITGIGFQPDVVVVVARTFVGGQAGSADFNGSVIRTSSMVGDLSKPVRATGDVLAANLIQSLDSDGFTVGTDTLVNVSGEEYAALCLKAGVGDLVVGTYVGNGTSQSITTGSATPAWVVVMGDSASTGGRMWISGAPNAYAIPFGPTAATTSNGITPTSSGFDVGSESHVNANGVTFHYFMLPEVIGRFEAVSYAGNGVDGRALANDSSFPADNAMVRAHSGSLTGGQMLWHVKAQTADLTASFNDTDEQPNYIQQRTSTGIELGSDNRVNASGTNYTALFWRDYTVSIPEHVLEANALSIAVDTPAATIANATPQSLTGAVLSAVVDTPAATIANATPQALTQAAALGLTVDTPAGTVFTGAGVLVQDAGLEIDLSLPAAAIAAAAPQSLTQAAALSITADTPAATIANVTAQQLIAAVRTITIDTPAGSLLAPVAQPLISPVIGIRIFLPVGTITTGTELTQDSPLSLELALPAASLSRVAFMAPSNIGGRGGVAGAITGRGKYV